MARLVVFVVIAAVIAAGLIWLAAKRAPSSPQTATTITQPRAPTSTTNQALNSGIQARATNSISIASTTAPAYSIEPSPTRGWNILKVDDYKFQISYPQSWTVAGNISEIADNPYPVKYVANFVTGDLRWEELKVLVVAVYDAPSISLPEWLNKAYQTDLSTAEKGGIDKALANSYARKGGPVYDEFQKGDTNFYGIGFPGPALFYTTYISASSSEYVYAVEIQLPIDASAIEPSLEAYKQIVSSFRSID